MDLFAGDKVEVLADRAELTLDLYSGDELKVVLGDADSQLQARTEVEFRGSRHGPSGTALMIFIPNEFELTVHKGTSLEMLSASASDAIPLGAIPVVQWIAEWFGRNKAGDAASAQTKGVAWASSKLEIPLLKQAPRRMAAGERLFNLIWTGGFPPYTISVSDQTGRTLLLRAAGLVQARLPTTPTTIAPGRYRIEIRDSHGNLALAEFDAVDPERLPSFPPDATLTKMSPDLRTTLDAALLASQGWRFEALLRVAPISDRYSPARLLEDALAQGRAPPPPP
jgi:hypothetical protein